MWVLAAVRGLGDGLKAALVGRRELMARAAALSSACHV